MPLAHTKIIQIVPRLPPYSDGVGDYARLLATQLSQAHHITTEFVSFRPGTETPESTDGFHTHRLLTHSADSLLSLIPQEATGIILHYSNYPYLQGKLDAPFWLVDALQQWHQKGTPLSAQRPTQSTVPSTSSPPTRSLVVMYHELPTLKWKKIRILNPLQSIVSRRLAKLANAVVTDSHHFKTHIKKWTPIPITCIPDFSTIGEPSIEHVQPLSSREPRLVVFGGSDRTRAYQHLDRLLATCSALGIQEICDIGSKQNIDPALFGSVTFTEMGFQSAAAVRKLLLSSTAGFMDYSRFPGDLGKSSVFAAFCAHGVMPICTEYNPSEPDGIFANQQYAIAGQHLCTWTAKQRQTLATQAQEWYSGHSLARNAKQFASYFYP